MRLLGSAAGHRLVMGVLVGVIVDFKARGLQSSSDLNSDSEILVIKPSLSRRSKRALTEAEGERGCVRTGKERAKNN